MTIIQQSQIFNIDLIFHRFKPANLPVGATVSHQIRNREIIKIIQILTFLSHWCFYIYLDVALFMVKSVARANLKSKVIVGYRKIP